MVSPITLEPIHSLEDLIKKQVDFQKFLGNSLPELVVTFECVQKALEHNTYQNIEFQEFMEADKYEKKEELIDYLLFMLNKYIYLGIYQVEGSLYEALWGDEKCCSSAACSNYASIEQYEFIKLLREHCTFKPWKVREGKNCAELTYVQETFNQALAHFRKLARVTYTDFYDLQQNILRKLAINLDRQNNNY